MSSVKESLIEQKQEKKKISCILVFILLLPLAALGFSIFLYLTGITSKVLITQYNDYATNWNNNIIDPFSHLDTFNFTVNDDEYFQMNIEQPEYNEYYPTQDSCLIDLTCESVSPAYYELNIPSSEMHDLFNYSISYDNSIITSENQLNITNTLELSFEDIGCVLTSDCIKECDSRNGIYDSTKSTCTIPIYLERICYRIKQDDNDEWILDSPTSTILFNNNTGCEYENKWKSHIYSTFKPDHLLIQLHYYLDPYIVSSSLTQGCSSVFFQDITKTNCFGHSDDYLFTICIIIGSCSLACIVIEIIVLIIYLIKNKKNKNNTL